jgi:DNA invertase Pin-like site-specific DNA recombinase
VSVVDFPARGEPERHYKIEQRHLDRLAVVYVRQSSLRQVEHNQESTRLQYGLQHRARSFGWHADRIDVIDDDLGVSGASIAGREGFQRLLSEIALDHVGMILGVEMSRLARSNRDWHQLLELCARFGTLIADLDGIYDPTAYNDRLLLGLKGTMSEAELHIIRQRMHQGKLSKARRGDLAKRLPCGYHRRPSGEVILDPDEAVRRSVEYVFDAFDRIGTVHGVLRHLVADEVLIGGRVHKGAAVGDVEWRRPHRGLLFDMLHNPIYAGAYVYGRRGTDPRRKVPGRPATGRTALVTMEEWKACVRDHHPAYITWERYARNQEILARNRSAADQVGAVRVGGALLQGLVRCGRCGHRMFVQYAGKNGKVHPRYICQQVNYGGPACQGLSAPCVDEAVCELALEALTPAAVELSLRAAEDLERDRSAADDLWQGRLERARYEAQLAARQYRLVDPDNRLVARTMEQEWEAALRKVAGLEEDYHRHQQKQPRVLSAADRAAIESMASEVPALWAATSTTHADRKEVLRLLADQVVVTVDGETEWVDVCVHWAGGAQTRRRVRRPVGRLSQLSGYDELLTRIRDLRRGGASAEEIADRLNGDGWTTPTTRNRFNERLVRAMMERHRILAEPKGPRSPPGPNEWWLHELAQELNVPRPTIYGWVKDGLVRARRVEGARPTWAVHADDEEIERLKALRRKRTRGTRTRKDS